MCIPSAAVIVATVGIRGEVIARLTGGRDPLGEVGEVGLGTAPGLEVGGRGTGVAEPGVVGVEIIGDVLPESPNLELILICRLSVAHASTLKVCALGELGDAHRPPGVPREGEDSVILNKACWRDATARLPSPPLGVVGETAPLRRAVPLRYAGASEADLGVADVVDRRRA